MRALVLSSLYPNSVQPQFGLFVHRRVEALARRGVEVRVVSPVPWVPPGFAFGRWAAMARIPASERLADLRITHPRYLHAPGPGMYVQAHNLFHGVASHVKRLQREFPFDFIDAHYVYPDGVAASHLARRLRVPVVITARGSDVNVLPSFAWVRRQIRGALRRADAVIGVSGALARAMQELGAPDERTFVIPNGIDRDRFHYADPLQARQSLNLFSDETLLLSVGNLNELKGHRLIIEAVAHLRQRGVRVSLHLFGDGPQRQALEALVQERGLQRVVTLHGNVPNERLARWYQAASLFVLASSREGWPNVLNEALACGLPVVATNVGGVPEIVTDGANGILTEERSVEALESAIERGLQHRWDRVDLASQAARRDWSDVADQLVTIYAKITGKNPPNVADAQHVAGEGVTATR
jgi:glycosyltransferase involved in cell wall biosynthesis